VLFVGIGQTYTDLRTLSVDWAVNLLMSWSVLPYYLFVSSFLVFYVWLFCFFSVCFLSIVIYHWLGLFCEIYGCLVCICVQSYLFYNRLVVKFHLPIFFPQLQNFAINLTSIHLP
jgi:hypothetical protein